ncbi:peptidase [Gardnerella vaginalis]|uniref:peptidase n=1 Tax=Gardnerella vaginalis TaxID=2702 RepID=UPI000E212400|nr:peptidase [Gardnerella vaginalis]RDW99675.1 peptidase [Gardnerella vaginalis]
MGKHGCKGIPIFLRNKRTRMFSLLTALLATIAIVVGNGAINAASADIFAQYYTYSDACSKVSPSRKIVKKDEDGNYVFCINTGSTVKADSDWRDIPLDVNNINEITARIAKSAIENDFTSQMEDAAYLIHEHYDEDKRGWEEAKRRGFDGASNLKEDAEKLWNEVSKKTPNGMGFKILDPYATYYARSGRVVIDTQGVDEKNVTYGSENTEFKVTAVGDKLRFIKDKKQVKEVKDHLGSYAASYGIEWVATGEGEEEIKGEYYIPYLQRKDIGNGAALIRVAKDEKVKEFTNVLTERAHRKFQPSISSKSTVKELKVGDSVEDTVTSALKNPTEDEWVSGKDVRARGYYFVGSYNDIMKKRENKKDKVEEYINELREDKNIRQVAAADVYFSGENQEVKAVAHEAKGDLSKDELASAKVYKVNKDDAGLFGTWVWFIDPGNQKDDVREFIPEKFVEEFGNVNSTVSHKAKISIEHVKNLKNKDTNDVSDAIVVSGVPKDYGKFDGNTDYGFSKDAKMNIRLWWVGNKDGSMSNENMVKLVSSSVEEPKEDENHKKIDSWDVPLRNGTYTLGNGKIIITHNESNGKESGKESGKDSDSEDNKGSEDNKENRSAENKKEKFEKVGDMIDLLDGNTAKSGMYVFVYEFPGSSRAQEFKTSFNNEDSRSFFDRNKPVTVTVNKAENASGKGGSGKQEPGKGEPGKEQPGGSSEKPGKQDPGKSEPAGSGNVTGSEVDPKTSPSGGVVDNIISKQDPQGSGKQDNPGKQNLSKQEPGKQDNPVKDQPGVQKPGDSNEKPSGLQPGGTQNNGSASSSQNGGASDVKNGSQSGESSGEPAGSGNVTGSEVDPKTSPSGGVVDNIISKQNPQNPQNPQSPQNPQGSGVQAGNNNQSGSTQGSGKNKPGKQQQPGNVNPVKSEPGVQKPGGSSEKPGGTQGSSAQNEVAGTQSGRAQVGNSAQSGVNAGANNNTLGAQVDAGTNNTVHQNADATGDSNPKSNPKSNANNDKINEKNNKKDDQSNVKTDSQHKSEHIASKEDSKEGKYTATKSGTIQRGDSKKVDTYQSATQQGDSKQGDSQYGGNQQVSDSNVEQNSQSNNQYASGTKNSKRRHARLGANVGHLVTTGVKVETTLMFSLAILLIAGSVILAKRVSYIA